ncbi:MULTISPECIES: isocitrate lyase/phosphoenolpyruvate mutase family protein [unclassified Burkholderia]|uniref:isocitrate lyase/PEP mutase family protein n=1 Tax=unclassified Burkholderia TaxID=2613784 RepID=UPI00141E41F5|nr:MULTISPECIES: isocitrate lyase/phosphoenolpyruvate mutase family protein [unclassified Burkholderia]NIE59297.1 isocitrate lyase/phosphoenolpyruvate mutase family protein [Burkholderia sp. Ap-955]NIF10483.1 isocitrate lyase/phosphoenolpyruvate mutase family protein [Burkholderia sp. Ax-1735]NIG04304.1 isocitrate lyase/phosphoenolpyruvate mutase family protein [Burkholderia sp. Tr-849]
MSSNEKGAHFRSLHRAGQPLALFNVWDAGSARTAADAGAVALATGSWSVAAANGFVDGEQMPRALMMDVLERITRATDLPVTVDLESGYGERPEDVAETIALSIKAGAIGCNLEDSFPATGELRDVDAAAARLAAARQAADRASADYFINARTDVFFTAPADTHDERLLDATLARARAYAAAGADGLFVPGLRSPALIRALTAASPLPVNVMRVTETPTLAEFAEYGVARISHGPYPYLQAMKTLAEMVRQGG